MADIDRNKDYTIVNASGVEIEVPGQVLLERALANEADTINGVPIREFVRQNVDLDDTIQKAHEQGVALGPLPDPKEEAKRLADIRELEIRAAVGRVSANPDDDNTQERDVLDNRDLDTNGVPDRVEDDKPATRKAK